MRISLLQPISIMRNYLLFFLFSISINLIAQSEANKEFIFDSSVTQQYSSSFDDIISVMADYYQGVEYGDAEKLDKSFHDSWKMRDNDGTENKFVHEEDKATFIKRVTDRGNHEGYASHRKIGAIEVIHDQLAFVRIDKAPSRSATLFFLANMEGEWKIIDKLWVYQEEDYNPFPSTDLLSSIQSYHNKKSQNEGFDSKLFSGKEYQTTLESQLSDHKIKLISILGVYDRLAIVRTDYPALNTTGYIVLFRLIDGWAVACERVSKKM